MAASDDILSLQEYWITRVKNVAMKFEKEGLELLDEYNALKVSIDGAYSRKIIWAAVAGQIIFPA